MIADHFPLARTAVVSPYHVTNPMRRTPPELVFVVKNPWAVRRVYRTLRQGGATSRMARMLVLELIYSGHSATVESRS